MDIKQNSNKSKLISNKDDSLDNVQMDEINHFDTPEFID